MKDAFDDLREMGVPLKAAEALRDDVRALLDSKATGQPALVIDVARGRIMSAAAGRGRAERLLVIERTGTG